MVCRYCKVDRTPDGFYFRKRSNGYDKLCKVCLSERRKESYKENPKNDKNKIYQKTVAGIFTRYRRSSKVRNIIFTLTKEQLESLIFQPCYYCGENNTTNGIDRVNNSLGYEMSNCVPCCTSCNFMKGTKSSEEFKNAVCKIYEHWANK